MKNLLIKLLLGLALIIGLAWGLLQIEVVSNFMDDYGVKLTEEQLGSQLLASEQEALIRSIAQEMRINKKFLVRKMNSTALSTFGYYNALVVHPTALNGVIPVGNCPILYASASFFEDITPSEQRFLIGHELIHARDGHCRLEALVKLIIVIFFLALAILLSLYFKRKYPFNNSLLILPVFLAWFGFVVIHLSGLYYRRQIEWVADTESFKLLNSYEGFLALNQRWQKEFCMPKHNADYFGWLADHPSCYEREQNCLALQKEFLETIKNN